MYRISIFIIAILFTSRFDGQEYLHPKQSDHGYHNQTEYFMFYSHFWLNAHHFLYAKAIEKSRDGKMDITEYDLSNFSESGNKILDKAVAFYAENLIKFDLRTSGYMHRFKRWIIQYGQDEFLPKLPEIKEHISLMNSFKDVYAKHFWPFHVERNNTAINVNISLIVKHESHFVKRLTDLCKAEWQKEKIRVDVTYHSKRDIPFTSGFPTTHIVMDSRKSPLTKGNWFELLLHEASHHLIDTSTGFVSGTISNVVETMNIAQPRQLWHAYLFYLSGTVAEELLESEYNKAYSMYMQRNNVFGEFHNALKHLDKYIQKEITLSKATKNLLENLKN